MGEKINGENSQRIVCMAANDDGHRKCNRGFLFSWFIRSHSCSRTLDFNFIYFGGVLVYFILYALSEMTVANPTTDHLVLLQPDN